MDSQTFRGINTRLPQKGARVLAALAAKGCRLPAQLTADPYQRGRRAHSVESLERAMGATAAMAAATAVHYSQPAFPSKLNPRRNGDGLLSDSQHGGAVLLQPEPANSCSHQQAHQKLCRITSDASIVLEMHDNISSFPEQWSAASNAVTSSGNVFCSADGAYHHSSHEGYFACNAAANQQVIPSRQHEPAAVGRRMTPSPLEMSFTSLLAASGASFSAAGHAARTVSAAQSPTASSSPRQPCSFHPGTAKLSESRQSPLGQPAAANIWLSSSLYGGAAPPTGPHLAVPNTYSTAAILADGQQCPCSSNTDSTAHSSSATNFSPADHNHNTTLLQTLLHHQLTVLGQQAARTAGQPQQQQVQGQQSPCSPSEGDEQSTTSNVMLEDDEDDNTEEVQHSEAVQLAMLKGRSRRLLTASSGGCAQLTAASATDVQQQQQRCVLPVVEGQLPCLTQDRRSFSAPMATILAAAAAASEQSTVPEAPPMSPRVLLGARAGSHSAYHGSYLAAPAHRHTAPAPVSSRLRPSDTSSGQRSTSTAWSDRLYAVIERIASTTQQHEIVSGSYKGGHSDRWHSRETADHPQHRKSPAPTHQPGGTAVMVLDMGIHKLSGILEPVQLVLALPPGLEARAHYFPPLSTRQQQTPGYLDAPAAAASPLTVEPCRTHPDYLGARHAGAMSVARSICVLPPVVMVFCAVDGYHDMLAADR